MIIIVIEIINEIEIIEGEVAVVAGGDMNGIGIIRGTEIIAVAAAAAAAVSVLITTKIVVEEETMIMIMTGAGVVLMTVHLLGSVALVQGGACLPGGLPHLPAGLLVMRAQTITAMMDDHHLEVVLHVVVVLIPEVAPLIVLKWIDCFEVQFLEMKFMGR